jgi:multidrug efflux pump subunit AcrB
LSLWLFDYPFGFTAIVGIMGLLGVAVNDAIMVLTALREHPQARLGNREAVETVVMRSTRHVLSTTVTTIAGFIPLIISGGSFWPPLAVAIAGGVAGATLVALYFVPSVYVLLVRHGAVTTQIPATAALSTVDKPDPVTVEP